MAFSAPKIRVAARVAAGVSLAVGLTNSFQVMGVSGRFENPIEHYGQIAFAAMCIVAILRLFAAVGLWAYATWGGFLLVVASLIEIFFFVTRLAGFSMNAFSLGLAVLLLATSIVLLVWRYFNARQYVNHL